MKSRKKQSSVANDSTLRKRWQNTRKIWSFLLYAAASVISIGGFLLPIGGSPQSRETLLRFAAFGSAAVIGIVFAIIQRIDKKRHVILWIIIAAGTLGLFIYAVWEYRDTARSLTCVYDNEEIVIGTEYTQQALEVIRKNPGGISCGRLLLEFGGVYSEIWTKDSIDQSHSILERNYVLCVLLLTVCILSVGQTVYSSDKPSKRLVRK